MSQTAIGKAALVLTTDAAGMRSGLDKAGKDVKGWSDQLEADLGKKAGGVKGFKTAISGALAGLVGIQGGLLGTTGTIIGATIGGPVGAAIGGAVGAGIGAIGGKVLGTVGDLAHGAVGVIGDTFSGALDTLKDLGKQGEIAGALGLTAEQFTGIAGVAKSVGEDTREFTESLVTMGNLGRDAAAGTEAASKAFKNLGLNADDFNKLRTDEQFFAVIDAMNKMGAGGARTDAIMKAFGEDGGKWLLPLLNKSPQQLREMAAGFAVSTEEMERAQATTAAWGRLSTTADTVWRRFAGMLAGPLEMIANGASFALRTVQPVFDWMDRTIGPVWAAGREGAELLWEGLTSLVVPAVQEASAWFERAFSSITEGVSSKWPTARELMISTFRSVGTSAALAWDALKPGAGIFVVLAGKAVEGLGIIVQAFKQTIKDIAALGAAFGKAIGNHDLAMGFASIYNQADYFGARIAKVGEQVKGMAAGLKAGTFGESALQFNAWLDRMLNRTKAAGNEVKGAAAAVETVLKKTDNAALLKGTSAEVSARLKYEMGGRGTPEKQLAEQVKGNGILIDIRNNTRTMSERPGAELAAI